MEKNIYIIYQLGQGTNPDSIIDCSDDHKYVKEKYGELNTIPFNSVEFKYGDKTYGLKSVSCEWAWVLYGSVETFNIVFQYHRELLEECHKDNMMKRVRFLEYVNSILSVHDIVYKFKLNNFIELI